MNRSPSLRKVVQVVKTMTPDRIAELTGAFQEAMALNAACASYLSAYDARHALPKPDQGQVTMEYIARHAALQQAEEDALAALREAARPVVARAASPSSFGGIIPS